MPSGSHALAAAVLAASALALGGCRLDLTAEVALRPDGGGTAVVAATFDPELLAELDALEVDPTAELTALVPDVPGWDVERGVDGSGALTVALVHRADRSDELTDAFRGLVAGLREDDPALVVDLEVDVAADGTTRIDGIAGLRPPATAGALIDDEPVGPSGDVLADLVRRHVQARLVVGMPGPVAAHDADAVDDTTLTWHLPVGEVRAVSATSRAPPGLPIASVAASLVLLVALAVIGIWRWRRR